MTQANDTSTETETTAVAENRSSGTNIGEQLRVAREQRSWSLEQASEALHLDEASIAALEQGRFETLGAPVYVRGHLKAYAQLLGLSPSEIVSEYKDRGDPEPVAATTPMSGISVKSVTVNPVLWGGGALAILLGLLLGIYVLLGEDVPDDALIDDEFIASLDVDTPVAIVPLENDRVEMADETLVASTPRVVIAPQAVPSVSRPVEINAVPVVVDDVSDRAPVAETAPRPVATMRLGLQFNQESWVEISDVKRRLLFGLQHKGKRHEIIGEPPFNLLIGNASAVKLTLNDEPFEVPADHVRGKVARFKINGTDSGKAE